MKNNHDRLKTSSRLKNWIACNYTTVNEINNKELKNLLSLSKTELTEEITISKGVVLKKLTEKVNESNDEDLNNRVNETINRINESEISLTSLYKLKQLEQGL